MAIIGVSRIKMTKTLDTHEGIQPGIAPEQLRQFCATGSTQTSHSCCCSYSAAARN